MRPPLQRLPVDLEEQPLVRPVHRVGQLRPHPPQPSPGRLAGLLGLGRHRGHDLALARLDRLDDLDQQALLRAEVVDEHPVAGAKRGGQLAEADVAQPVLGDVVDGGRQQPLP